MPRPGRAYWKGFLRLSLVSIPVEIYTAVETAAAISLNQIHKPTGKRINYTKTVKGVGPVDTADIVKGYEVDKDVYVTLDEGEIESLKLEFEAHARPCPVHRRQTRSTRAISRNPITSCPRTTRPPKAIW